MTAPAIGRLRQRIVIEAPADIDDGAGGFVRTHVEIATVFAAVGPAASSLRTEAGAQRLVREHRILLRRRDDLTSDHRLKLGARVFRILGLADVDGEGRFLQIAAEELAA